MRTVRELENLQKAAGTEMPSTAACDRLKTVWPNIADYLVRAMEQRMTDRTKNLGKMLVEKADREIADVTVVLEELKSSIEEELEDRPKQLSLFSRDELEQLERNRQAGAFAVHSRG